MPANTRLIARHERGRVAETAHGLIVSSTAVPGFATVPCFGACFATLPVFEVAPLRLVSLPTLQPDALICFFAAFSFSARQLRNPAALEAEVRGEVAAPATVVTVTGTEEIAALGGAVAVIWVSELTEKPAAGTAPNHDRGRPGQVVRR